MFGFFKRRKQRSPAPAESGAISEPIPAAPAAAGVGGGDPVAFIARIPGHAAQHVATCKEVFGVSLNYSPESLRAVDDLISLNWTSPPVMLDEVVAMFGSYVGETMRRHLGGEWAFDPVLGVSLARMGGTSVAAAPFDKVRKRFTQGEGESIAYFYAVIGRLIADEKAGADGGAGAAGGPGATQ